MSASVLARAHERVREGLAGVREELSSRGMPSPEWEGNLIRPVMGLASLANVQAGEDGGETAAFWRALAAVQLAHEASLLHDDVIDGASERRGRPTMAAAEGVGAALVEGDHLLTSSYRMAAATGNAEWMELFARAVERTVAGEKAQARSAGAVLDRAGYEEIVLGKSGELMGAAFAAGPMLRGAWEAHRYSEVGRRVGLVYQMLDDLLDYCVEADTGKPALVDYRRGLWTWPRELAALPAGLDDTELATRLRAEGPGGVSLLERCLAHFRLEVEQVRETVNELLPGDTIVSALLDDWLTRAEAAQPVQVVRAAQSVRAPESAALPPVVGWETLMAEHAKSFRFAARLFPAEQRSRVVSVYAWCRYTDDLVDGVDLPAPELEARLDAWLDISRRAYEGEVTGNELADRVMGEMSGSGVPFAYAAELLEGMRMDVRGVEYGTLAELWTYTYRVASVVGLWTTELFGIRDPWMLDRAASLGHAMQLTNILRDVGEDLAEGRLYLPTAWLRGHGLERGDLQRMASTGEVDQRYRTLVERLLRVAESEYDHAEPAIALLPAFYRRPVAVAADVYRGIHDEIRANGHDNLTRRAYTGLVTKLRLGAGALIRRRDGERAGPGVGRTAALFAVSTLLWVAPPIAGAAFAQAPNVVVEAARGDSSTAFTTVGLLWIRGVEDEDAVHEGLEELDRLGVRLQPLSPSQDRLLRAYRGSFTALLAKHGGWPRERLRNLQRGFELMDAAVAEAPEAADLRYIRLMSGFYLPGVFGRGEEVSRDMSALVRLLPHARSTFPPELFPEVVAFVLENGSLDGAQRQRLEALLP